MQRALSVIVALTLCSNSVWEPARSQGLGKRVVNVIPSEECDPGPTGLHPNTAKYPFDLDRIFAADAFARKASGEPNERVKVVVLDTGFVGYNLNERGQRAGSKNFPTAFFYNRNSAEFKPFRPVTPLGAGKNPLVKGHGTHVTGVLLGGMVGTTPPKSDDDYSTPEVRRLLMYDPAKANLSYGPFASWIEIFVYGISLDGETLDSDALERFNSDIRWLPEDFRPPDIMNVSLLYSPPTEEVHPTVKGFPIDFPNTLVVAAAGNLNEELLENGSGHYPAMSTTNEAPNNLIVVGSHDADLGRSKFSNYHRTHVSLAAPGCGIKSWFSGTSPVDGASGTSQAAAYVSFAAALLKTHWRGVKPSMLRERLLISARYSQDLAKGCPEPGEPIGACVFLGNLLDIEASLYFKRDIIEYCTEENGIAPNCDTKIAVGELTSVPPYIKASVEKVARLEPADQNGTGLSWPAAIRRTDHKNFEAIVRPKKSPWTLEKVYDGAVENADFTLIRDGDIKESRFASSRVSRVITRSNFLGN